MTPSPTSGTCPIPIIVWEGMGGELLGGRMDGSPPRKDPPGGERGGSTARSRG